MKVALSAYGRDLDAQIDPRFGRCAYFIIVDTDDMSFEAFDNESIALGGGAGIQSAQFVASKGAEVVITGNCGPKAVSILSAAGITLFVDQTGTVKEVIARYNNRELISTTDANVSDHYGTSGGRGMDRGMGMGRGRGMSRGVTNWNDTDQTGPDDHSNEQELRSLKIQANDLKQQMEEIQGRIEK